MKYLFIFFITCAKNNRIEYSQKNSFVLFKQKNLEVLDSEVSLAQFTLKEITTEHEKEELLLDLLYKKIFNKQGGADYFLANFRASDKEINALLKDHTPTPELQMQAQKYLEQKYIQTNFKEFVNKSLLKYPITLYKKEPPLFSGDLSFIKNQSKGSGKDTLTLFLNFGCGHCLHFLQDVLPGLEKKYSNQLSFQFQSPFLYPQFSTIEELHECSKEKNAYFPFQEYVFQHIDQIQNPNFIDTLKEKFSLQSCSNQKNIIQEKEEKIRKLSILEAPVIYFNNQRYFKSPQDLSFFLEEKLNKTPRFIYSSNDSENLLTFKDIVVTKKEANSLDLTLYKKDFALFREKRELIIQKFVEKRVLEKYKKSLEDYLITKEPTISNEEISLFLKNNKMDNTPELSLEAKKYISQQKKSEVYHQLKDTLLKESPSTLFMLPPEQPTRDFKEDLVVFFDFSCPESKHFFEKKLQSIKKNFKTHSFKSIHKYPQLDLLSKLVECSDNKERTILSIFKEQDFIAKNQTKFNDVDFQKELSKKVFSKEQCLSSVDTIELERAQYAEIPHTPAVFMHGKFFVDFDYY